MKKKPNKSSKEEPKVPQDRQEEFDALVDKFMDSHNMSGEAARRKAHETMKLEEGVKRAIRQAKAGNIEAAEKEVMRQAARRGRKQYELDFFRHLLPRKEIQKSEGDIRAHGFNIQKIALETHPNFPGERYQFQQQSSKLDRDEMKKLGKKITSSITAHQRAEDIYADQPVVRQAEAREKSNWLKKILRMKDLGLV